MMRSRGRFGAAPPMAMAPSPAAPGGPVRKRDSFVDRLTRGISSVFGGVPEAGAGAYADEGRHEGSAATLLRGIVRINNEKRLAISFTLQSDVDWRLPEKVKVVLDGQEIEVEVERQHSTQDGQLAFGHEVRLVLRLSRALPGKPLAVHVPGKAALVVELVA